MNSFLGYVCFLKQKHMSKFKRACRLLSLNDDTAESLRNALLEDERTKLELKQESLEFVTKAANSIKVLSDSLATKAEDNDVIAQIKLHEATPEQIRMAFECALANRGGFMCDHRKTVHDKVDAAEKRIHAINLLKSEGYKVLKPTTKYHPV